MDEKRMISILDALSELETKIVGFVNCASTGSTGSQLKQMNNAIADYLGKSVSILGKNHKKYNFNQIIASYKANIKEMPENTGRLAIDFLLVKYELDALLSAIQSALLLVKSRDINRKKIPTPIEDSQLKLEKIITRRTIITALITSAAPTILAIIALFA